LLLGVLRRFRDAALVLATTIVCAVLSAATMVVLGYSYDLANIIVLPLLLGLSLVYGIYFILRWRSGAPFEHVLQGSTPRGVLYSGATTLGTFGSLMLASDPGVGNLGRALVIALGWVLVSTLLLLPSLLTLIPHRTPTTNDGRV
jgi:predicted RND superfamily exporter protein